MVRRFFYDTEFIEYPGSIDLISIGVVSEGGEPFYACNLDADLRKANDWVRDNVIMKLPVKPIPSIAGKSDYRGHWMHKEDIAKRLLEFLKPSEDDPVELWGYYSAYDHVVLCWLFGAMIDLPAGMPMFTKDLMQLKEHVGCERLPEQAEGEHDALADARWNRQTFLFLREYARENQFRIEGVSLGEG